VGDCLIGGHDNQNKLYPDQKRFLNRIKYLADYVHQKGLKIGIYSGTALSACVNSR